MRSARSALTIAGAVVSVAVVAVVFVVLINSAEESGRGALRDAKQSQIDAIAASLDVRISSALGATAGLAQTRWELTEGSEADLTLLSSFLAPDATSGFFLIDDTAVVTQGVLLGDTAIGSSFDRLGWSDLVVSPAFQAGRGAILPVDDGITTPLPTYAFLLPILDPTDGRYRGTFVFEADITPESDFSAEISEYVADETSSERYLFVDTEGVVVASNDTTSLAAPIDPDIDALAPGVHERDEQLVTVAAVPSAGWRLVHRQDLSEFESDLVGPLETVGAVVVVLLMAVGAVLVFVILRRLQQSRQEALRLAELARSQEEFISIVSHELRTPVAGTLGFLQTTLDHWREMPDGDRRVAVERAARNARRLQALTRDILDAQAVESGSISFHFDTADLREEIEVAVTAMRDAAPDREIRLDLPTDAVHANVDADRLQQVLLNLFENAIKHSGPADPVSVTLVTGEDGARITVRDRGVGVDDEAIEKLFEKFVRGRDESSVTGTGLGLYISRNIVEAHGGTITGRAADGGGAEFVVTLPRLPDAAAVD